MDLTKTNVENWDSFLYPIILKNIDNQEYQCNNSIILVPLGNLPTLYVNKDRLGIDRLQY